MFFLQIRFLRVAYDEDTVELVAQEQVKGCAYLRQKNLDAMKQAYFKGQESQKGIKKELRERPTTSTGVP